MFIEISKAHCFDERYGSYKSLEEALLVCAADKNCGKVYDQGCNNEDDYALCPFKSKELVSTVSCMYAKPGKYGNVQFFTLYIINFKN